MPKILMARIDNRLVHGQVGTAWTRFLQANLIIVADDDVAHDDLQKSMMRLIADISNADIRFFTIQETIDRISYASDEQHILLVTKTPQQMRKLVDNNVPITEVNIGNMHGADGKKQYYPSVFLDQNDISDIHFMIEHGINVVAQTTPNAPSIAVNL